MTAWKLGGILTFMAVAGGHPAFAQTLSAPSAFVEAAIIADRDQREYFYGSTESWAARGAVGVRFSDHNGFRFEVDVPKWRAIDRDSTGPV